MYGNVLKRCRKYRKGLERSGKVNGLPLTEIERFPAKLRRRNRVQVPLMVRWRYRLRLGEMLRVSLRRPGSLASEVFYGRLIGGGRLTVPKLVVDLLEIEPGDVVNVTLYPQQEPEKKES